MVCWILFSEKSSFSVPVWRAEFSFDGFGDLFWIFFRFGSTFRFWDIFLRVMFSWKICTWKCKHSWRAAVSRNWQNAIHAYYIYYEGLEQKYMYLWSRHMHTRDAIFAAINGLAMFSQAPTQRRHAAGTAITSATVINQSGAVSGGSNREKEKKKKHGRLDEKKKKKAN